MLLLKLLFCLLSLSWAVGSGVGLLRNLRHPSTKFHLKEERTKDGWMESWDEKSLDNSGITEKPNQHVQPKETDQNLRDLLTWLAQHYEIGVHYNSDKDGASKLGETSSSVYYDGIQANEREVDSYWHQPFTSAPSILKNSYSDDMMSLGPQQSVKRVKSPPRKSYTSRPSAKKPKRNNGHSPAVIHGPSTRYYSTVDGNVQHAMGFSPLSSVAMSLAFFAFLSAAVSSGVSRGAISTKQLQKMANDLRLKSAMLGGVGNIKEDIGSKNPIYVKVLEAFKKYANRGE